VIIHIRFRKGLHIMNSSIPTIRMSTYYTVREAAWILGVAQSEVSRAIRTGTLPSVRRRSRLVVPAYGVARLLGQPTDLSPPTAFDQDSGGDAR
jgi:excisionase family DNA binding protein